MLLCVMKSMNFDAIDPGPSNTPKLERRLNIGPELGKLIDAARAFTAKSAENADELIPALGRGIRDSFDDTLFRTVRDAEECSKMRAHSDAVSKSEHHSSLTSLRRDWGDEPKDGISHYEQACKKIALDGFMKVGLQPGDADKLVSEIFKS